MWPERKAGRRRWEDVEAERKKEMERGWRRRRWKRSRKRRRKRRKRRGGRAGGGATGKRSWHKKLGKRSCFAGLQLLLEFVRTSSGLRAWLTRSRVWLTPLSFLLAMNNMVVRAAYRISPERVGKALRDCRSRHTYSQKRLRIAWKGTAYYNHALCLCLSQIQEPVLLSFC